MKKNLFLLCILTLIAEKNSCADQNTLATLAIEQVKQHLATTQG